MIILYETLRAFVVCKLTIAAGNAIAPSEFDFPIFGPIFCGTIAGCGGAFLRKSKTKSLESTVYCCSVFVSNAYYWILAKWFSIEQRIGSYQEWNRSTNALCLDWSNMYV